MHSKVILVSLIFTIAATSAELLCYRCDDCHNRASAQIEPCGFDDPVPSIETIPATMTTTTTEFPWPTIVLTPLVSDGDDDGEVISRHPSDQVTAASTAGGRPGTDKPDPVDDGAPLLTPPNAPGTIYPARSGVTPAGSDQFPDDDRRQYGCMVARSIVENREVVRRGCIRLDARGNGLCIDATGNEDLQCSICTNHLCNSGN